MKVLLAPVNDWKLAPADPVRSTVDLRGYIFTEAP